MIDMIDMIDMMFQVLSVKNYNATLLMIIEEVVEQGGQAGTGDGEEFAFSGADAVGESGIDGVWIVRV